MAVDLLSSQVGTASTVPLPYTGSPLLLLYSDVVLFFHKIRFFLGIIRPLKPFRSGKLDELYPSPANLRDIAIHIFLFVYQFLFLVTLPCGFAFPLVLLAPYLFFVLGFNYLVSKVLNGSKRFLESRVPVDARPGHEEEHWIFINGVAVGHHWLQSNVDRISQTFGRKIVGVHNKTWGIIFDTIECLIQRNFSYATPDIRDGYRVVKEALIDPKYKKLVLILHSQGGIVGGMVVDWLLDEIPHDLLQKLEVYTFGNAANHFNNPHRYGLDVRHKAEDVSPPESKAIRHIEHYANHGDFVSVWGVLNFIKLSNRYMGRLFTRQGSGHQLNQHYLDNMFPLGPDGKAMESNDFMDAEVSFQRTPTPVDPGESLFSSLWCGNTYEADIIDENTPIDVIHSPNKQINGSKLRVKDFSRLWQYRNGRSPSDRN